MRVSRLYGVDEPSGMEGVMNGEADKLTIC